MDVPRDQWLQSVQRQLDRNGAVNTSRYGDYRRLYATVLDSLPVGGRFVYTPSLPSLGVEIDGDRYRVKRWSVVDTFSATSVGRLLRQEVK